MKRSGVHSSVSSGINNKPFSLLGIHIICNMRYIYLQSVYSTIFGWFAVSVVANRIDGDVLKTDTAYKKEIEFLCGSGCTCSYGYL